MKKDIHNGEVKILSNEMDSCEKDLETIEILHHKCEKEIIQTHKDIERRQQMEWDKQEILKEMKKRGALEKDQQPVNAADANTGEEKNVKKKKGVAAKKKKK